MIIEKIQRNSKALPTEIRTSQAIDTGMAMVLIGLLACWVTGREIFLITSIGLLLINMIWPRFYVPAAKLWLGFSTILGALMAKVVMVVIFVCVVSPIAFIRRVAGI